MATKMVGRTVGRINEFTMCVPMKPGWLNEPYIRFFLGVGNVEFNIDTAVYKSALKRIGTVHFVRALVLDNVEPTRLFFSTEFDRDPERYLDDFSDEGHVMFDAVLKVCEEYPGARPVDRFRQWVKTYQVRTLCFWGAYDAPVRKIEVALALLDQWESEQSKGSIRERIEYWQAELHRLLARAPIIGDQAENVNELTVVVPVKAELVTPLRTLEAMLVETETFGEDAHWLLNRPANGLEKLGTVHFARIALIDNATRLVLALEFDGELGPLVSGLSEHTTEGLDQILSYCEDYPGAQSAESFRAWIMQYRQPHAAFYSGHGASLQRVTQALDLLESVNRGAAVVSAE